MRTEHALLQAIKEQPADDNLRLILADWLDDNGQPERGEFVRLQVQRSRLLEHDPRRAEMERREGELLNLHAGQWLGPLAHHRAVIGWEFRRGLLSVRVNARKQKQGALLAGWARARQFLPWIAALRVDQLQGRIAALLDSPVFPFLTSLCLFDSDIGEAEAETLAGSAMLNSLTDLDMACNGMTAAGVAVLANCPYLSNLTSLNLWYNAIGEEGKNAVGQRFSVEVGSSTAQRDRSRRTRSRP